MCVVEHVAIANSAVNFLAQRVRSIEVLSEFPFSPPLLLSVWVANIAPAILGDASCNIVNYHLFCSLD